MISPALQQPQWPDRGRLETVVRGLESLPPLVLAAECDQLKQRLASVARGEAFLLQGGDCAETFVGTTADSIGAKFRTLLQMAVVLTYAASVPVVKVGGGIHIEFTGDDVTECIGGGHHNAESDLNHRYETTCDPRLNRGQSLDLAFRVAELYRHHLGAEGGV